MYVCKHTVHRVVHQTYSNIISWWHLLASLPLSALAAPLTSFGAPWRGKGSPPRMLSSWHENPQLFRTLTWHNFMTDSIYVYIYIRRYRDSVIFRRVVFEIRGMGPWVGFPTLHGPSHVYPFWVHKMAHMAVTKETKSNKTLSLMICCHWWPTTRASCPACIMRPIEGQLLIYNLSK